MDATSSRPKGRHRLKVVLAGHYWRELVSDRWWSIVVTHFNSPSLNHFLGLVQCSVCLLIVIFLSISADLRDTTVCIKELLWLMLQSSFEACPTVWLILTWADCTTLPTFPTAESRACVLWLIESEACSTKSLRAVHSQSDSISSGFRATYEVFGRSVCLQGCVMCWFWCWMVQFQVRDVAMWHWRILRLCWLSIFFYDNLWSNTRTLLLHCLIFWIFADFRRCFVHL